VESLNLKLLVFTAQSRGGKQVVMATLNYKSGSSYVKDKLLLMDCSHILVHLSQSCQSPSLDHSLDLVVSVSRFFTLRKQRFL